MQSALRVASVNSMFPIIGKLYNKLGAKHSVSSLTFTPLFSGVQAVACSAALTVALSCDGTLLAFGENRYGQCGTDTPKTVFAPNRIEVPGVKIVQVAAGFQHVIALGDDGRVYAFGKNDRGQAGLESGVQKAWAPAMVRAISADRIVSVAAGFAHSVAVSENGSAYVWGKFQGGRLADPTTKQNSVRTSGTRVPEDAIRPRRLNLEGVKWTVAGQHHTLFGCADGRVFAMGMNRHGEVCGVQQQDASGAELAVDDELRNDLFSNAGYGMASGDDLFVLDPVEIPALNGVSVVSAAGGFRDVALISPDGNVLRYAYGQVMPYPGTADLKVSCMSIGWQHGLIVGEPKQ
jgi:alpha-tubulin suppressor-like RCC1 family protein